MRILFSFMAIATLAACQPPVPDSGAGVGFDSYDDYQRQRAARDAQLAGSALPPAQAVSTEPLGSNGMITPAAPPASGTGDAADIAAETRAILEAQAANSGEPIVNASPSNPVPQAVLRPSGISNENDFNAVGEVRSIEGDAARIAANRAQYQVVQPTALPDRGGNAGPNIVAYALQSSHAVGTKVYSRSFASQSKYDRNCASYASPDLAQADFLAKGGPNKDRLGIDPDGDGYACGWNPAPFRKALSG